jgi:hypothetical protein
VGNRVIINSGGVNFASNSALLEFPTVTGLRFASFIGNGSLNALDNTDLSGTGNPTNVGSGPTLQSNYGTFTYQTAAWTTAAAPQASETLIFVTRYTGPTQSSTIAGLYQASDFSGPILWLNSTIYTNGGNSSAGFPPADSTVLIQGSWYCIVVQHSTGVVGVTKNLSIGTSTNSSGVQAATIGTTPWQIGTWGGTLTGYTNTCDIAFAMICGQVMSGAQLTQAYNSLKRTMSARNISIL